MEDNKQGRNVSHAQSAVFVLLAGAIAVCLCVFTEPPAIPVAGAPVTPKIVSTQTPPATITPVTIPLPTIIPAIIGPATIGPQTIQDRQRQYGPAARARLAPFFERASVRYPPAAVTLVGIKSKKIVEVYATGRNGDLTFIRDFPILAASGGPGPKLREGDRQVPEGVYGIELLNPNSHYHLALRVNYPNDFDRQMARRDGRSRLGGDIMIHGSDCSIGCLAMGDEAAEDLFVLAADAGIEKLKVILAPKDFRTDASNPPGAPQWADELYNRIRTEMNALPTRTETSR